VAVQFAVFTYELQLSVTGVSTGTLGALAVSVVTVPVKVT